RREEEDDRLRESLRSARRVPPGVSAPGPGHSPARRQPGRPSDARALQAGRETVPADDARVPLDQRAGLDAVTGEASRRADAEGIRASTAGSSSLARMTGRRRP